MNKAYKVPEGNALVLRTCNAKLQGYGRFQWPTAGPVKCNDWNATPECGNGLHGLLWGVGGNYLSWKSDAVWLVVEVELSQCVTIGGDKVKFPCGNVVHCGTRQSATQFMAQYAPLDTAIVGRVAFLGDNASITAGDNASITAGDIASITVGIGASIKAGIGASIKAGWHASITAGRGALIDAFQPALIDAP